MTKNNLISLDEARKLFAAEPVPEPEPEPTPERHATALPAPLDIITLRIEPMIFKGTIDGMDLIEKGAAQEAIASFQEDALRDLRELYHKGEIIAHSNFVVETDRDIYRHQENVAITFTVAKPPAEGEPGHGVDLSGRAQEVVRLLDADPELKEIRLQDHRQQLRPTVGEFGAEYQQTPGREVEMHEPGGRPDPRFRPPSRMNPDDLDWSEPKQSPRKGDRWMSRGGRVVKVVCLIRSMTPAESTVEVQPEEFSSHVSSLNLVDFQRDYALCYREQPPTFRL